MTVDNHILVEVEKLNGSQVWEETSSGWQLMGEARHKYKEYLFSSQIIGREPSEQMVTTESNERVAVSNQVTIKRIEEGRGLLLNTKNQGTRAFTIQHESMIIDWSYNNNRNWMATSSTDGTARLWDLKTGQEIARMPHEYRVGTVVINNLGNYILTVSDQGKICVWAITHRALTGQTVTTVEFSRLGNFATIVTNDGFIEVYRSKNQDLLWRSPQPRENIHIVYDPTEQSMALLSGDSLVEYISLQEKTISVQPIDVQQGNKLALLSSGRFLIIALKNGNLIAKNTGNFETVAMLNGDDAVRDLVQQPSTNRLIIIRENGRLEVLDYKDGKFILQGFGQSEAIDSVSQGGNFLALGKKDGNIELRHMTDLKILTIFNLGKNTGVKHVAISNDGHYLIASDFLLGSTAIFDVRNNKLVSRPEIFPKGIPPAPNFSTAFAVDWNGDRLAFGSVGVQIMSISSGSLRNNIFTQGFVESVDFSQDGRFLVASSRDKADHAGKVAHIYDLSNMGQIANIQVKQIGGTPFGEARSVSFSPDGHYIILRSKEHAKVFIWRAEDLINGACDRVKRNLSLPEWDILIGSETRYKPTCKEYRSGKYRYPGMSLQNIVEDVLDLFK